ncbi:MAG: iron-containing alcohol dehydrogenase [Clostridia bacterium]|nr:iron-containing alcohol dehydrogenase [Clostridia bacterium]
MFFLKKIGCRVFQVVFRLALPILPYREPKLSSSCMELKDVFTSEGISSVLVVTDTGIINNGLLKPLEDVLCQSGVKYTVYNKTRPNPTVDNVEEALELYHKSKCQGLIAVGGGSSIDCAKAIGARVAYPKKQVGRLRGILRVLRKTPTVIAIPTTAGTGSEVTLASVITDTKTQDKYALMSFPLIPHYAVLDPVLTYTLPPHLTATTGMDALTHAVEAYIGRSTTKETRALALEATRLIFENIYEAYQNGQSHKARENMLLASYKAGVAFSKSYVGYIHAIAHSLGGKYGIPHGLANAVIMPYVLENYGQSVYKKLHQLATIAGVSDENDTHKLGAKKFICAIKELNTKMGIPTKLDGIIESDIKELARHAEREANPLYPVPKLMTAKELEKFYYRLIK